MTTPSREAATVFPITEVYTNKDHLYQICGTLQVDSQYTLLKDLINEYQLVPLSTIYWTCLGARPDPGIWREATGSPSRLWPD